MRHLIILVFLVTSLGCAATTGGRDPSAEGPETPASSAAEGSPSAPRGGSALNHAPPPRFVEEGITVRDTLTGSVWYGTDAANAYDMFSAAATCAGLGYRAASSAEVEALGGPLPEAFHAVYAWASHSSLDFFPDNARPVVTSDGCVDVTTAQPFAGDCVIPGIPKVTRSAMCIMP